MAPILVLLALLKVSIMTHVEFRSRNFERSVQDHVKSKVKFQSSGRENDAIREQEPWQGYRLLTWVAAAYSQTKSENM